MSEVKYYWAACPEFEGPTEKVVLANNFDRVTAELTSANSDKEACAQNAIDLRKRVDALQQRLTAADERQAVMEKALMSIARPHDCGCLPCHGDCTSKLALEITVEEMRETARLALKPTEGSGDEA